ncbi:MAG: hypothetical protein IPM94_16095 [bacterium]|nr:hypothetical protein [bacterium]
MNVREIAPYDENRLTEVSREFASELFARFPELRQHSEMERFDSASDWSLVVDIRSPGDEEMIVCLEWGTVPTVFWGPGHWHDGEDGVAEDAFDLIAGIFDDRLVMYCPLGSGSQPAPILMDSPTQEQLLEALTDPCYPDCAKLVSWSGRHDRLLRLKDLNGLENT